MKNLLFLSIVGANKWLDLLPDIVAPIVKSRNPNASDNCVVFGTSERFMRKGQTDDFSCPDPISGLDVVCGSDGRTYLTAWQFEFGKCQNPALEIQARGPCVCQLKTPRCLATFEPICADDRSLHSTSCALAQAGCSGKVSGVIGFPSAECKSERKRCCQPERIYPAPLELKQLTPDAMECVREPGPICGPGWLQMAKCLYFSSSPQVGLRLLDDCGERTPRCPEGCHPSCGSDGNIYGSDCVLRWAQRLDSSLSKVSCKAAPWPPEFLPHGPSLRERGFFQ